MSTHYVKFRANSITANGEFNLFLPDKGLAFFLKGNPHYNRPVKTLILLHGFSADRTDWLYGAPVQEFSMNYNLAIVMPSGGQNFYLDGAATCKKGCTFIGEDLINFLRDTYGLCQNREDTMIGGVSMGGFGALHTALAYPETFSKVICLSSAFIIHQLKNFTPDMPAAMANYDYYVETFGDLDKAEASDHNPEVLFIKNKEKGIENPRIYMACGTEDFLYQPNQQMKAFLEEQHADFKYEEGPGVHSWDFWGPYCRKGLEYFLKGEEKKND